MPKPEGIAAVFKALEQKLDEDINYVPSEEVEAEMDSAFREIFDSLESAAVNVFSEDQIAKMDSTMFGMMGGLASPFLGEKHMAGLELTDAQREQFRVIDKELAQERDKMIAELSTEMKKAFKAGKLNLKDLEDFGQQFKELMDNLQKRRSAILTEEQLAKAAELSKPPKFLTVSPFTQMATQRLQQWVPNFNSWKPGDPVPEQPQQERRTGRSRGFPRGNAENNKESEASNTDGSVMP
jgi:Spy/CpxP family protein refolding chaperone